MAVAACQPLPRPFLPEGVSGARHRLLQPGADANLLVMPIQGAPASRAMAEQVAIALRRQGVAAGTDAASRSSYAVWGMTATGGDAAPKLWLRWRLLDPNGMPAGTAEHDVAIEPDAWRSGGRESVEAVAESAARTIVALIRGEEVHAAIESPRAKPAPAPAEKTAEADPKSTPPVTRVVETATPPAAAGKALRTVVIQWSGGAPGDGAIALPKAMSHALKRRQLTVAEAASPGSYRLVGQTILAAEKKDVQEIAVQWSLRRPDGGSIATVSERLYLARARLDRGWGAAALRAAEASADTLAEILRVLP